MEKKKSKTNPPPTMEEFENVVKGIMFKRPPTLKQLKEMNKRRKE